MDVGLENHTRGRGKYAGKNQRSEPKRRKPHSRVQIPLLAECVFVHSFVKGMVAVVTHELAIGVGRSTQLLVATPDTGADRVGYFPPHFIDPQAIGLLFSGVSI